MSALASRSCAGRVASFGSVQRPRAVRSVVAMAKPGLHPEWFGDAPVFCNGVEVMRIGGTKSQYNVDIYSGNHPFYQGNSKAFMVMDDGQLNKFKKRFAELDLKVGDSTGGAVKMDAPVKKNKGKKK